MHNAARSFSTALMQTKRKVGHSHIGAEQLFTLMPDGLTVALTIENRDDRAMPAGIGLHPFFPRRPRVKLRFEAKAVYPTGANFLPTASIPVPAEWDYHELRSLGEPGLDNCFTGWDGSADILFVEDGVALRLRADPVFGHLVVYVPAGREFFAVEPVSHLNDAINRPDMAEYGLKVLRSGERLAGTVRFGVEAL